MYVMEYLIYHLRYSCSRNHDNDDDDNDDHDLSASLSNQQFIFPFSVLHSQPAFAKCNNLQLSSSSSLWKFKSSSSPPFLHWSPSNQVSVIPSPFATLGKHLRLCISLYTQSFKPHMRYVHLMCSTFFDNKTIGCYHKVCNGFHLFQELSHCCSFPHLPIKFFHYPS